MNDPLAAEPARPSGAGGVVGPPVPRTGFLNGILEGGRPRPPSCRDSFIRSVTDAALVVLFACAMRAVAGDTGGVWRADLDEWPTYHGDYALSGVCRSPLPSPSNMALLWRCGVGGRVTAPPVAGGGRVYACAEGGRLAAVRYDGTRLWAAAPSADGATNAAASGVDFAAPPLYVAGRVIAGSQNGVLYAFDAASGRELWRVRAGEAVQGTANCVQSDIASGFAVVAVSQPDGVVRGIDPDTGSILWASKPTNRTDGSPAAAGDAIVFGNCDAAIHVVDAVSGKQRHSISLGADAQVAGGTAVAGDLAFVGDRRGRLVCANIRRGEVVWAAPVSKREVFTTPAVATDRVVVASADGRVYAVSARDGHGLWSTRVGRDPGSPAMAAGCVVATGDGAVHVLRLSDGLTLWSRRVSDEITSPAVANSRVFVGTDEGDLVAFGAKEGSQ